MAINVMSYTGSIYAYNLLENVQSNKIYIIRYVCYVVYYKLQALVIFWLID